MSESLNQEIERELAMPRQSLFKFSYVLLSFLIIMVIVSVYGVRQIKQVQQYEGDQEAMGSSIEGFGTENTIILFILSISILYAALLFFWYLDKGKQVNAYLSLILFPMLGSGVLVAVALWTGY